MQITQDVILHKNNKKPEIAFESIRHLYVKILACHAG